MKNDPYFTNQSLQSLLMDLKQGAYARISRACDARPDGIWRPDFDISVDRQWYKVEAIDRDMVATLTQRESTGRVVTVKLNTVPVEEIMRLADELRN